MRRRALILALVLGVLSASASAAESVGVVLLHGKTGMPSQFAKLAPALTAAGYRVATPEMCWSKNRIYDRRLADCLKEVDDAVASLKAAGATKVVVGGMSLGGLVILNYAATHSGFVGVIALAPAGDPRGLVKAPAVSQSLAKAQAMDKAGEGNSATSFADQANSDIITVTATPKTYIDFVSPDGALVMYKNLLRIRVPLLWVAGKQDGSQSVAATGFSHLAPDRLNRLVWVDAEHTGTPDVSAEPVLAWLRDLAGRPD